MISIGERLDLQTYRRQSPDSRQHWFYGRITNATIGLVFYYLKMSTERNKRSASSPLPENEEGHPGITTRSRVKRINLDELCEDYDLDVIPPGLEPPSPKRQPGSEIMAQNSKCGESNEDDIEKPTDGAQLS